MTRLPDLARVALALLITFSAAALSYAFVETPELRLNNRLIQVRLAGAYPR